MAGLRMVALPKHKQMHEVDFVNESKGSSLLVCTWAGIHLGPVAPASLAKTASQTAAAQAPRSCAQAIPIVIQSLTTTACGAFYDTAVATASPAHHFVSVAVSVLSHRLSFNAISQIYKTRNNRLTKPHQDWSLENQEIQIDSLVME